MEIKWSQNNPGVFYISEKTIDEELVFVEALHDVEDEFYLNFVKNHKDEWRRCVAYQETYIFDPDYIPLKPISKKEAKKYVEKKNAELKHLTYKIGEILTQAKLETIEENMRNKLMLKAKKQQMKKPPLDTASIVDRWKEKEKYGSWK